MLNHSGNSSESSNEIRMIPICGIPKPLFILTVCNLNPCHSTVGTKFAIAIEIEMTDYTFVVLERSIQLPLSFPRFCNGINPKPCGNPFIFLFIHCVNPNPGLIPHINFLIVFVVNCLRGGRICEELRKRNNIWSWRIYFIKIEMPLLQCHRGVVLFVYLKWLVVVAIGITTLCCISLPIRLQMEVDWRFTATAAILLCVQSPQHQT